MYSARAFVVSAVLISFQNQRKVSLVLTYAQISVVGGFKPFVIARARNPGSSQSQLRLRMLLSRSVIWRIIAYLADGAAFSIMFTSRSCPLR